LNSKTILIVSALIFVLITGISYWGNQNTLRCPSDIPLILAGETEVLWGELEAPYFSAELTSTDVNCSIDDGALPSLVMTIDVQGYGRLIDPVSLQAVERLSFDLVIKALDKEGTALAEQLVAKTLYVEDVSTDVTDVSWSQTIEIEARQAQIFDMITVQWAF
jgi:hypothetical protein